MASARFPPTNPNDFRLPSLKDLNFPYKPLQDEQQSWPRNPHENSAYSVPLSAQAAPIQPPAVPVSQSARIDDATHSPNQVKRTRTDPREIRTPHTPYPPQYVPYPQQQQQSPAPQTYHPVPTSSAPTSVPPPPPPPHDQIHHHPIPMSTHPAYSPYPSQYIPARPPPVIHPHHPQQQPPHANPYPSPGPPPSAPPPQGQWIHHQHSPQSASHLHHQAAPAPPPLMAPHHHQSHPHHQQPPPPNHVAPHAVSHQPPPQVAHLPPANQPQHPQQQQQQQPSFSRSTTIVPANIDARDAYEADDLDSMPSLRDGLMAEVVKRCSNLYSFAKNQAQFPAAMSHARPPSDLANMSRLAADVVNMLEQWKRNNTSQADRIKLDNPNGFAAADDSRPPKRPWEDMSGGGTQENSDATEDATAAPDTTQSTAEQDMELIRTKRASSTAGGGGTSGQPKSKYRKRSRATPPGKCHSCNIRETPEWRRGPDGARTLCNACGLHYAKLMRKKEKSGNEGAEVISLEDLRASARSHEMDKSRSKARAQQSADSAASSVDGTKQEQIQPPLSQQHHQGSFQLMSLAPDSSGGPPTIAENNSHMQATNQQTLTSSTGPISVSSHSWPAAAQPLPPQPPQPQPRYAPDQFQHQSFMRSSQQHVVIPQASPR